MTVEIGLVFGLVAVALYLFARQRLPIDVSALAILAVVMAIPIVGDIAWLKDRGVDLPASFPTVEEGLSGLSSPATVTVLAMFILSAGIQRSGLIHQIGRWMVPLIGNSELRLLLVTGVLVGLVSGVINNTAAVAVAMPLVLDICRNLGLRASQILIPLSYIAMLGGMLTVIGTSTNILAVSLVANDPELDFTIGMFEFTHVGILVLVTGIAYLALAGRFLLPKSDRGTDQATDDEFDFELRPRADSSWLGQPLSESGMADRANIEVLSLIRDGVRHTVEASEMAVQAGDVIRARGSYRAVADLIAEDQTDVVAGTQGQFAAERGGVLVRALVRNRNLYDATTVRSLSFWQKYRARLVGLESTGLTSTRIADEVLHVGSVLLLHTTVDNLPQLRRHADLILLSEFEDEFDRSRMKIAAAIVAAVVVTAAVSPLPIVVTALFGVVAMVVTGCVTKDDIYSTVPWDVIILLAGVIPLGVAMSKSGGARWLGDVVATQAAGWHPLVVLMAVYALTTTLTEFVSSNAAAVILIPVATTIAAELGLPPIAFVMVVMFAASTTFLSPIGYQTNTMVFATGLYRFGDFAKVGAPLNLILMGVTCTAIWWQWI